jgi:type I restriction enzyme S subunit
MSATVRAEYKQTQVGTIPLDWHIELLGRIGQWFSGGTPSLSNELYWSGDIPWVSPKDMKLPRLSDAIDHISSKAVVDGARVLPVGAVLMVIRGMILAHSFPVARVESPLAFNQDIKAVVPRADIDSNYVLYWLMAHKQHLRGLITESTHGTKRLPTEALLRQEFCLPPLPEQRAIAAALSDVDALLAKLDALVAKKRDLKQAVMQQLLTGETRLPGFSEKWEMKPLGDVSPLQRGFDLLTSRLRSGAYPVVYSNGVSSYHDEFMVKGPGVVTGRSGTIGNVHFVDDDYWPHNTSLWVTSFKGNLPKFIYYLLSSLCLEKFGTGSGVPTLNRNDVHALRVLIPQAVDEQTAIATVLSDMDAELVALEARRDKTRALKQGMMQELLTGRIRLV